MKKHHLILTFLIIVLTVNFFSLIQSVKISSNITDISEKVNRIDSIFNEASKPPKAPELSTRNAKGMNKRLKDLSNKKRKLIVFTQKGCVNCNEFIPELNNFSTTNSDYEIVVIELNITLEELLKYEKEKKYNFETWKGNKNDFINYNVTATPTTFLLDKDNRILKVGVLSTKSDLEEWLIEP